MEKNFRDVKNHKNKVMLLLLICLVIFLKLPSKKLSIDILDVGQGDGICIETSGGKVITIDGGSSDVDDVGKYRLVPYLKYKGISTIDFAFISHMDSDHMNGIRYIVENNTGIIVKNIVIPYIDKKSDAYEEFEELASNKKIRLIYMKTKDVIKLGKLKFECLHPSKDYKWTSENGYSLVVLMSYKKFDMLFTGDVEKDGEEIVRDKWINRDIEVLKISHHGSKNSSTIEFLDTIKPRYAVISAGKDNRYGHPHNDTLERLKQCNIKKYSTIQNGAISIKTDGEEMSIG